MPAGQPLAAKMALRALKEINSLFATAAYPLLTESGDLMESRLAHPA